MGLDCCKTRIRVSNKAILAWLMLTVLIFIGFASHQVNAHGDHQVTSWEFERGQWTTSLENGVYLLTNTSTNESSAKAYSQIGQSGKKITYEWTVEYVSGDGSAGFHFQANVGPEPADSYLVFHSGPRGLIRIYKAQRGALREMLDEELPKDPGTTHRYRVDFHTSTGQIDVYYNDRLVASWVDPQPLRGEYIAVRTNRTHAIFRDVKVTVEEQEDDVAGLSNDGWNDKSTPNPVAVQEVLAGIRQEASAAWWGFDPEDSTDYLQAAIDSGVPRLMIPKMGGDWIVRPITLRSNQEIIFEDGVVITAKKGEYLGTNDSVFTALNVENLVLRGYGATIRMHKDDYTRPPYRPAEWRMGIRVTASKNVEILGLTIRDTGGDGIYVSGGSAIYSENVVIRDVVVDNNHRQGISVISVKGLLIENTVFKNTSGTPPMAGIDFEPNRTIEKLEDIVVRNSVFEGNEGSGILFALQNLDATSDDISIIVENVIIKDSPVGVRVGLDSRARRDNLPRGEIVVRNCVIENTEHSAIRVRHKDGDMLKVHFEDCYLHNVANNPPAPPNDLPGAAPIAISGRYSLGGISFNNVTVVDELKRPLLLGDVSEGVGTIFDISGAINAVNPNGADVRWNATTHDVSLTMNTQQSVHIPYDEIVTLPGYDLSPVRVIDKPTIIFNNPSLSDVRSQSIVSGTLFPKIQLINLDEESVLQVEVFLNDAPLYSGETLMSPDVFSIDTTTLEDGDHTLKVSVRTKAGSNIHRAINFSTRNFQTLVDLFEGPKEVAWFGTFYSPVVIDQSDGWVYKTDYPEDFFGNTSRKTRKENTTEYLVWRTPGVREFDVEAYVKNTAVGDVLNIHGSVDGETWHEIPYGVEPGEVSRAGWQKIFVKDNSLLRDLDDRYNFIRLTLLQSEDQSEIQLGQATFIIFRDGV